MQTITSAPESTTDPAPTTAAPSTTLGLVSLGLGLAAIVTGFQLWLGVPAVIVGVMALRQEPRSKALAVWGIITGAISGLGLVASVVGLALFLPFAGIAALWGYFG